MKILGLLLLLGTVISCNYSKSQKNDKEYQVFNAIQEIQLPLEFNSNQPIRLNRSTALNDSIINSIIPSEAGFVLFGKTYINDNYLMLIGMVANDQGSPFFITVDNKGTKIDSFLAYKTAGADMGWYCSNHVVMHKGNRIEFVDSTLTREINADDSDEIPGTDKIKVEKKTFIINSEGLFKEK